MNSPISEILKTTVPFLAGFVTAIFAPSLRNWLTRPSLRMTFNPDFGEGAGFISLSPEQEGGSEKTYCVRAAVQNKSRFIARNCQAYLISIEYKGNHSAASRSTLGVGNAISPDGYQLLHQDPIPLRWAFVGVQPVDLPPKLKFHVDVFKVNNFKNQMVPQTQPQAVIWASNLTQKGWYRYTISMTGENINPVSTTVEVNWQGDFETFKPSSFRE